MQNERMSGNEEIVEEMQKLAADFHEEKFPNAMRPLLRAFRDGKTLLVRIFADSKDHEDEVNDYYPSFIENIKELWSIACTSPEESAGLGTFREESWEEFFRTVRDSRLMTGAIINPSGKRFVIPQELMSLILDAWDQMKDE